MMEAQKVHCPNCSASIPAEDINIVALMAKCGRCHHVFRLPQADLPVVASAPVQTPARPGGIVHELGPGGDLYLRRSWFTPGLVFLLFFCIAWDGFLVFWYGMALFGGAAGGGAGFWLMVLFPICHVAAGVGLTYYVVAGFLNKTQILAGQGELHIRHRPIPWRGNRTLATDDIQGFELDRSSSKNGQQTYALSAHHVDGDLIVLLSSLPLRQAEYIGHVLGEFLEVPFERNFTEL